MAQRSTPTAGQAVNLLALDGGGIRGVSELLILDEIMRRVQYDLDLPELPQPCDYFDLVGGTSTGG
ncbi:FabD/lysophospholipase-like protein [Zopfia rhizophila CBS 207.26]|uniref:FabD/lysophospholipase-like protein n=1 Tax=Zopfia rhizophila CBS 207.26 TaxID=1314779 RepID=A0A6A6DQS8_9PEZI|nr:FabD/lysophospholipase-like protein [Zopfia rhizophila CBS 207.26]